MGVVSFIIQQTELSQSNTHMNYVYAVLRCEEQDTQSMKVWENSEKLWKHSPVGLCSYRVSVSPKLLVAQGSGLRSRALSRIKI